MEYMGTKEAAEKWGYTAQTIRRWCKDKVIKTAEQDASGSPWRIPINEPCPKKIKKSSKTFR